ncbi:MAG: HAMP domain-containing histidine kinase [Candidatus Gastranaerophilales bacterium]|nr:HAMP domain-containing histidine kinase [Candidatus Gastranaerophilales bacterium]
MKTKSLNQFFKNNELFNNRFYSKTVVKSLIRSVLEPITTQNSKALVYMRLKNMEGIESLIKRIEYLPDVTLNQFGDFEFSKFDSEEVGFIVLTSQRYNCALLFKEIENGKYEIYLKLNSKLVSDVYETLKSIFLIGDDKEFYSHKPERRENSAMNNAVENLLKYFEDTVEESECNLKIQETYKNVNLVNKDLRKEVYQNVKAIAHEIKNQLSILDIYTRIFEKKTQTPEIIQPIRKSVEVIKKQLEQFKNIDVVNLCERNVKEIIQESIKMYSSILKEKNNKVILIDEMPEHAANAFVDEDKLSIVINNVIKNANDSTKNDEILIKLAQVQDKIKISFVNHGQKIKQQDQEKIFSSGYTTKKDGWGVGLSVCKKFIGSQFGSFELEKSDDKETIFSLKLPLA